MIFPDDQKVGKTEIFSTHLTNTFFFRFLAMCEIFRVSTIRLPESRFLQINTETMIFSSISTIETRTITSPIMLTISNGRRPITKVASSSSCTINTPV